MKASQQIDKVSKKYCKLTAIGKATVKKLHKHRNKRINRGLKPIQIKTMIITEIHCAYNCVGELQRTKKIKPREIDPAKLELIRQRIAKRYPGADVFFVYKEPESNNLP